MMNFQVMWQQLKTFVATSATSLTTGTLPDARLSANVTVQGNTFNGASQLVKTTTQPGGRLPSILGANVSGLAAFGNNSGLSTQPAKITIEILTLTGGTAASTYNSNISAVFAYYLNTPIIAAPLTVTVNGGGHDQVDNGLAGDNSSQIVVIMLSY